MNDRKNKGTLGEKIAINFLIQNNYKIKTTNYSCLIGEIDIIAENNNELVFIEVRSRTGEKYGLPVETVNYKKQTKLRKIANFYLKEKNLWSSPCRFDIVSIIFCDNCMGKFEIKLYQNAF